MRKIPLIIDTDPGIDDAGALICAFNNDDILDIKLITTVFGNVSLDKTTNNALKIVEFMKKDIAVAKGAHKALICDNIIDASEVHGESGMDGYDFKETTRKILDKVAIEAIKDILENSNEKVNFAMLGSLTNLALFLLVYPHLKEKIGKVVIMGGSLSGGNTNTVAEFNIYNDPHAAQIVFNSGLDIYLFALDITRKCLIDPKNLFKLENGNENAKMVYSLFKNYRSEGFEKGLMVHDASTIAYLLKPELFRLEEKYIEVITEGIGAGALVADYYTIRNNKKANVKFANYVDSVKFEDWIIENLGK